MVVTADEAHDALFDPKHREHPKMSRSRLALRLHHLLCAATDRSWKQGEIAFARAVGSGVMNNDSELTVSSPAVHKATAAAWRDRRRTPIELTASSRQMLLAIWLLFDTFGIRRATSHAVRVSVAPARQKRMPASTAV
jgi:hypothetical protein